MTYSLTKSERETIVSVTDGSTDAHVWTAQRAVITRLRRDAAFREVASGRHGSTEWAEFKVPADRWSPAGVKRKRNRVLSDAERKRAGERLARGRRSASKATVSNPGE